METTVPSATHANRTGFERGSTFTDIMSAAKPSPSER